MSICDIGFRTTMSKRVRGVKNISAIGLDQTRPSGILSRGLSSVVFAPFIVIISQWSKSVTHVYTSTGLAHGGLNLHYSGVIMDPMASQITGISIVTEPFVQAQIKENIRAPRYWPLRGKFTGDRWIARTKGQ